MKIGICDTKLGADAEHLQEVLNAVSGGAIEVTCIGGRYEADLPRFDILFAHLNDYKSKTVLIKEEEEQRAVTGDEQIELQCCGKCHLVWTSSTALSGHTIDNQGVTVHFLNHGLPNADAYIALNWEEALAEWEKHAEMARRIGGIPPAFPVETLQRQQRRAELLQPFNALDVLLQGYLAVWRPQALFADVYQELQSTLALYRDVARMRAAQEKTAFRSSEDQRLFSPDPVTMDQTDNDANVYWFATILPDITSYTYSELAERFPPLHMCIHLKDIYEILRGECLGMKDGRRLFPDYKEWSQDNITDLVLRAHQEFVGLFNKNIRSADWVDSDNASVVEKKRQQLRHDFFKNAFMEALGFLRNDLSIEERGRKILTYWGHTIDIVDERDDTEAMEQIEPVNMGLSQWEHVSELLHAFWYEVPGQYGFRLTEDGFATRTLLFDGPIREIDHFVTNFLELGHGTQEQRFKRITKFFEAADLLHEELKKMRRDQDLPFGGYLIPE